MDVGHINLSVPPPPNFFLTLSDVEGERPQHIKGDPHMEGDAGIKVDAQSFKRRGGV